mmetsp:Transcript_37433/g.79402  ORF Transcript_37433/g.79402 Transcript_37433/m.79402 type:complete len:400 (+) Transcript_37433:79-1278(+)|eukprot:CAMPEP_0206492108 /NCGR_PEP_ID=MMETSP0324_2-20121206/45714_1 /ASSEMBLY_ACC=CAM_ASM_000836 /TAXON_ID=2866 /ORGANISM="Crypthecodinium cohnii, Strain Seligo" /LENGTH=399 /DNA_ID=CAMNT_0053974065 /DNA_START=19 /DNA_END=1218 /DNA_ORIENTATION=+
MADIEGTLDLEGVGAEDLGVTGDTGLEAAAELGLEFPGGDTIEEPAGGGDLGDNFDEAINEDAAGLDDTGLECSPSQQAAFHATSWANSVASPPLGLGTRSCSERALKTRGGQSERLVRDFLNQRLFTEHSGDELITEGAKCRSVVRANSPEHQPKPKEWDPQVVERLLARKDRKAGPLSPDHTFRPEMSPSYKKRMQAKPPDPDEDPNAKWQNLAYPDNEGTKRKLEDMAQAKLDKEMAECTFAPQISVMSASLIKKAEESGKLLRDSVTKQHYRHEDSLPPPENDEMMAVADDATLNLQSLEEQSNHSGSTRSNGGNPGPGRSRARENGMQATGSLNSLRRKPGRQLNQTERSMMMLERKGGISGSKDAFGGRQTQKVELSHPVFEHLHQVLMSLQF